MQLKIKATGFPLTELLERLCDEKLRVPLEKRLGSEMPEDIPLEVELAKVTRHHEEGKIWKCEANLVIPHEQRTVFVEVLAESIEAAINEAKDELERQVSDYRRKKSAKFLRVARSLKEELHVSSLAKKAKGVYLWFKPR